MTCVAFSIKFAKKQIRNLPKILNFVKIIHYYSKLFTSLLSDLRRYVPPNGRQPQHVVEASGVRHGGGPEKPERVRPAWRVAANDLQGTGALGEN